MSVVRTKYIGAELQYDGLEEVKVRVDKKCRCDCRVKEEVLNTHISSNNYPRRWFSLYFPFDRIVMPLSGTWHMNAAANARTSKRPAFATPGQALG